MKTQKQSWGSRLFNWMFPPIKWQVGDYGKVMVHSENNWMYFYVKILAVNGDSITVEYLNDKLRRELKNLDPSWWFINPIDRRNICLLAYDEMKLAIITEEKNRP